MPFESIPEIIKDLQAGRVIVLVDDENRENEGDFVIAAEYATPEVVNFLARVGGGYLCVALDGDSCERLELGPQGAINTSLRQTPFTISVDGHPRHGVTTGISASDRAATIKLLSDPSFMREYESGGGSLSAYDSLLKSGYAWGIMGPP